jgi:hypothetical protein
LPPLRVRTQLGVTRILAQQRIRFPHNLRERKGLSKTSPILL